MIEINPSLLSELALENLIIEVISRQATEYGEFEVDIQIKKYQLFSKIKNGFAKIVYSAKENICDIITTKEFEEYQRRLIKAEHESFFE